MSADLRVDLASPVPPFEQIRAGIAALVERGDVLPGARLPTVRSLAADLGVAAGTVARAYRELEAAGVVESHGRRGTAVRATPARTPDHDPDPTPAPPGGHDPQAGTRVAPAGAARPDHRISPELDDAVRRAVATAHADGLTPDELVMLIRRAYAAPTRAVDTPARAPLRS